MGYRKEKKAKNRNKSDLLSKLKTSWSSKRPVVIFVGGFAVLIGVFYAVWFSQWFNVYINPKITAINAFLSCKVLHLLGQGTSSREAIIYSPVFSISVARGCDGIEAMAIFVSALLVFPVSWRKKIKGAAIGILLLFLLNLFRIISLFMTGVYCRSLFDVMHVEIWQVVFIFAAVALWVACIYRFTKNKNNAVKKTHS